MNDERGRSPARRFPGITEGEAKAESVTAMSTTEFRAWVKTLDPKERRYWRRFRKKLSKDRYEAKRLAALAGTPRPDEGWEKNALGTVMEAAAMSGMLLYKGGDVTKLTASELALLPPEMATEIRRQRRREAVRRWREENREKHRQQAREQWERIKADPERHAAYLAKKAEAMRRKREEAKRDDG